MQGNVIKYRPDIDGLRAIAVSFVVFYHAFPRLLPGGFVGVDIFFVISGFLITAILLREMAENRYSIAKFYERRIRRIFPALCFVMAVCLAVGWVLLQPPEFQSLGKNAVAGMFFSSNLLLMRGPGYFDTAEAINPLLHFWSLGVEEQFYIVWPFLIVVGTRLKIRPWMYLGAVAGLSFLYNLWQAQHHPISNFYNPLSRFWELSIGAGLAYAQRRRIVIPAALGTVLSLGGLALMVASALFLHDTVSYPGAWALLPTMAAAAFIAAEPSAPANRWLSNRAAVALGLISYPLYLWHWPIFAFARICAPDGLGILTMLLLIAASVAAAALTYRYVELPLRAQRSSRIVWGLCSAAVAVALVSGSIYKLLLPAEAAVSVDKATMAELLKAEADFPDVATVDRSRPGARSTIFIGDSYVQQYYPRIAKLAQSGPRGFILMTKSGCAPFLEIERRGQDCAPFFEKAFARAAAADVDRVVLGGSWFGFLNRGDYYAVKDPQQKTLDVNREDWIYATLAERIEQLRCAGKQVTVILVHPQDAQSGPEARLKRDGLKWVVVPPHVIDLADFRKSMAFAQTKIRWIASASGARLLDPADYLCSGNQCPTASPAGIPFYKDRSHLRASFARDRVTYLDSLMR